MMQEKRALGKGLSALISENLISDKAEGSKNIPIGLIASNPFQPRKNFDQYELGQLSQSIKEHGILQPILVREKDGGYQIVAGERRWRASSLAGLKEMPALVVEVDDAKMLEMAIIENVQRANLNPIEEALAYKRMMDDLGCKQEEVSTKLGKSREHVANMIRLLKLPEDVQQLVSDGRISVGHARAIVSTENPLDMTKKILAENLTVRQTESFVKDQRKNSKLDSVNDNAPSEFKTFKADCDMTEVASMIEESLGMKVKIVDSKYKGGEVRISFMSYEQLDYLLQVLSGDKLKF